ncbi:MAG: hypothetical protein ACPW60_10215 [Methylohalobius sp. ZOD2]
MMDQREKALSDLPLEARADLLARAADLGITRKDDVIWRLLALAIETKAAAKMAKSATNSIPSKIKSAAREAGRDLREDLSKELVTTTRSLIRSQKLISFSGVAGVILISMLTGAVFCLLGLATTGHLNPTQFAIKPAPGGVEIQAPGPVDARWCDQSRQNCLLLKSKEKLKRND